MSILLQQGKYRFVFTNCVSEGNSPIITAICAKNVKAVELLLNAGADISVENLNIQSKPILILTVFRCNTCCSRVFV
jgi:hypothetical protein